MKRSKALVTLAIGEKYLKSWKKLCEANWQKYADKHGYDVICIETPLDDSERAKGRYGGREARHPCFTNETGGRSRCHWQQVSALKPTILWRSPVEPPA